MLQTQRFAASLLRQKHCILPSPGRVRGDYCCAVLEFSTPQLGKSTFCLQGVVWQAPMLSPAYAVNNLQKAYTVNKKFADCSAQSEIQSVL